MESHLCLKCKQPFFPSLKELNRGRGKYCSKACYHASCIQDVPSRFWSKVLKTDTCWLWTGATCGGKWPYGKFGPGGRGKSPQQAHRVSWKFANGEIPEGLWVLHKCDNPRCVNPDHLFLGLPLDNSQDMVRKGRSAPMRAPKPYNDGEKNPFAKLTTEAVLDIRSSTETQFVMAKKYGVCPATISFVRTRRRWKSV